VPADDVSAQTPLETLRSAVLLQRCASKFSAVESRHLRKFAADQEWASVGALKPQAYLATKLRVPSTSFNRSCSVARRLGDLPAVEAGLAAGDISPSHRDKILAVDNPRVHDALVADQAVITGWARTMRWRDFEHALGEWLEEHDQDGPEPDDTERSRADWSKTFQDRWRLDADLDAVGGAIWAAEADRLGRLEFERDWLEARERLGREPAKHELQRTDKQRRAAAMVTMARRSATGPERSRQGAILLSIFAGPDWFRRLGELDNGTVVRPGQLASWLDDVSFETFLYDADFREITVSTQRTYRGALRRFAIGRDGECFHEYCDEPASRNQADHRIARSKGGPTSGANGQGGCPGHNRAKGNKDPTELEGGP
jgi:hypothetical protein